MQTTAEFDAFVVARGPALLRFAYLLTGDRALAEDLVQEALLNVLRRWHGRLGAAQPDSYVRRAIVNQLTSWRRRRSSGETPMAVRDSALGDSTESVADRDLVWRALATVAANQRAVLVLRYYEGLSDAAIAEVLGCAEGTVRSLAARAFEKLRSDPQLAQVAGAVQVEEN